MLSLPDQGCSVCVPEQRPLLRTTVVFGQELILLILCFDKEFVIFFLSERVSEMQDVFQGAALVAGEE